MFEMSVGDCFSFIQNGANIKQGEVDGGYPITRIETVSNNRFNRDRMGYAGITDITPYRAYVLEDGDILMSHINSVRYLGRAVKYSKHDDETIIHGMNLLRLKAIREIVIPDYACLYFSSRHFREQISRITKKSVNQASFSVADLKRAKMLIASLEEQKQIVALMSRIDGIMQTRKAEYKALDQLIKARFVEMFGDPEYNNKRWPLKRLNDLCNVGSSKRIYQEEQTMEGVPFWRISDLVSKMDTGNVESSLFIPESRYEELKGQGLVPEPGDILVTSRGTLGRCYIVDPSDRFYFQDGMISWLSNYSDEIMPLYIQYLFNMSGFKKQIDGLQTGSTVAYLSIAMLKKLNVMVPSRKLQEQFVSFVSQVDKSKLSIQASLDQLETLKQSLMQKYFG